MSLIIKKIVSQSCVKMSILFKKSGELPKHLSEDMREILFKSNVRQSFDAY